MKKFFSFFVMLMLCALGVTAQIVPELEGKAVCVGNALPAMELNTWYFLHQSRLTGGGAAGEHSVVGEQPTTGGFIYDAGPDSKAMKSELNVVWGAGSDKATLTLEAAKYMVRFVESGNQEGACLLQFGTGTYLGPDLVPTANVYDAVDLNIYCINDVPGHFAINKWEFADRLDNNGSGAVIAWWGSGKLDATDGNNDWAIHEVVWGEIDERQMALDELVAVLTQYSPYSESFETGTEIGQYDEAAFDAFFNAVQAGWTANRNQGGDLDIDGIKALAQAIVDTYNACVATRVRYAPADGYYNIVSAMEWTNTITIPAEEEGAEPTTEETHPVKAMYVEGNNLKWGNYNEESCAFLWKLEATDTENIYTLTSMATDGGINPIVTSQATTMAEGPTKVRMQFIQKDEAGRMIITFTGEKQTGAQQYAHCGNHAGGLGVGGNIVGWGFGGIPASEWVLAEVDPEDAKMIIEAYEPIKNHDVLVEQYNTMKADAIEKLEAAKEIFTNVDEENPLITEATQFYSPQTTTDLQCETLDEVYTYLLDGKPATYWHSRWEDGNVAGGVHYLQVELPEGSETIENAAIKFTRRAVANDHITVWGVYGTNVNDADFEEDEEKVGKDACELLGTLETPFASNTETVTSGVFPLKGYKYIRFYINNTVGSGISATRGYGHVSEFQMYPAEMGQRSPNQYATMGEIVTNLEAVLAAQSELTAAQLDVEAFTAFKAAYDAFIARYTDPAPLRAKIAAVEAYTKGIKIGTNPGEWNNDGAAGALAEAIAQATAYDLAAVYTPEQSAKWIADLDAAAEAVPASANQIQEGKWYYFRFGTQEEYEANEWSLNNAEGHISDNGREEPELFGKYLTLATVEVADPETGAYAILPVETEEVGIGSRLYFMDKEMDITDADQAKWRFVNVADTAYVIQNKATGLFLRAAGTSGSVTLSVHPTLFAAPKAIGYGEVLTTSRTLDGANCNNLHAQRDYNTLVTWASAEVGSNSGLFIEEAEDVAADYEGTQCAIEAVDGEIAAYCYPVDMTCTAEDAVLYAATLNGTEITLNPLKDNKAHAGQPFLLIKGSTDSYVEPTEETERDRVSFAHGYAFVKEAAQLCSLVGTYASEKIGAGKVVPEGNTFVVTKKSATMSGANSAYIAPAEGEELELDATLTITISSDPIDNIADVIANVTRSGAIYTIDGRKVAKGNINTLRQLGRGIYIVNGTKVIVK